MGALQTYLREMARIRTSGEATQETSFYPAVSALLNQIGASLDPSVHCVLTPRNRGAGIPDGGLFLRRTPAQAGANAALMRAPERGVVEVKGLTADVRELARGGQVRRYLERYGRVLVTNLREFQSLQLSATGKVEKGEHYSLAGDASGFWALTKDRDAVETQAKAFEEFLTRTLMAHAPVASPEQLAWFLASYARVARERLDAVKALPALDTLRGALEEALGLRFTGSRGSSFFRSALVQTLFYGVFAAWVVWSERLPKASQARFSWRTAQWTLDVPMVRVLFEQLATPRNLPAGIDEILDWTEEVFSRVEHDAFFARFDRQGAVQYFYEPFLEAYDPELRREVGVWYTPPEVVRYMVARVDEALKRDLDVPLGLADDRVHILDPCTGTGSFLVETLRVIGETLRLVHDDTLVAQQTKTAAMNRVHGFELLPAPFVIAHLQIGMLLDRIGAPLDAANNERVSVYLTNALSGWSPEQPKIFPFEEFRAEREAAGVVKRAQPILVVLGNPPYNGYSGVSGEDEDELVQPYKHGLSRSPWEITKNKLDDLYVRFFRVAERRIAERTGRGIVCYVSNSGWLGDPSAVVMRKHLVREFGRIYVDNLNGDSRETGKRTPGGQPDPSVFSTRLNPSGIQVGTAIALLVRTDRHDPKKFRGLYRDFWGVGKREQLLRSLDKSQSPPRYEQLIPDEKNWYRLRRWRPREGYESWPLVTELAATEPELGLNENRGEALISIDAEPLLQRLRTFLDSDVTFSSLSKETVGSLVEQWSEYDPARTRDRLLRESPFDERRLKRFQVKPFDVRWAYIDVTPKLWNRSRPAHVRASDLGADYLLVRKRSPRALDGAAFLLSPQLFDQHVLHKDAYAIPLLLPVEDSRASAQRLFDLDDPTWGMEWRPNLSEAAKDYLLEMGYRDAAVSRNTASVLWLHVLAIGYSPLYVDENADGVKNSLPRVPLPRSRADLDHSAALGARVAALLNIDELIPGVDTRAPDRLRHVAEFGRVDNTAPQLDDLSVDVGWGVYQSRKQKSGVIGRVIMPGDGRLTQRPRTHAEGTGLSPEDRDLLGDEVVDVYLNERTWWRGVSVAAWDYKIGGFQVLRKWLSYREESILGRRLHFSEARQFTNIARRVTELVRLAPDLDANYRAVVGVVDQDPLPAFSAPAPRVDVADGDDK